MKEEEKNKEAQLDIIPLIIEIWGERKFILRVIGVFVAIGLLIAIFSPVKYTASATLLPSQSSSSMLSGSLGSLASLAGVNIPKGLTGTEISPELYPKVSQSVPYLLEMINVPLSWEESEVQKSILDEVKADTVKGFADYTLGLPGLIKSLIMPAPKEVAVQEEIDFGDTNKKRFCTLSRQERNAIKEISNCITVDVDPTNDLIIVNVTREEKLQCAQLAQAAVNTLQDYIIKHKTLQAVDNLAYIENSFNDAKVEYETTREALYNYTNTHRDMVDDRTDLEYHRLSDAFDVAASVFKTLAQQLAQSRIAVKGETPVFSILEPVVLPKEKSAPKRTLILIVSAFLGGLFAVGYLLCKIAYRQIVESYKQEKSQHSETV